MVSLALKVARIWIFIAPKCAKSLNKPCLLYRLQGCRARKRTVMNSPHSLDGGARLQNKTFLLSLLSTVVHWVLSAGYHPVLKPPPHHNPGLHHPSDIIHHSIVSAFFVHQSMATNKWVEKNFATLR